MINMNAKYNPGELQKMREELQESIDTIIRNIADQILAESQLIVPVDKATLKKSGNVIHGNGYSFIGYNTPYAKPVHDGYDQHVQQVPPHMRNMSGVIVRVREHERLMPARTGKPYLDDAIEKVLKTLDSETRSMIQVTRVERLE